MEGLLLKEGRDANDWLRMGKYEGGELVATPMFVAGSGEVDMAAGGSCHADERDDAGEDGEKR